MAPAFVLSAFPRLSHVHFFKAEVPGARSLLRPRPFSSPHHDNASNCNRQAAFEIFGWSLFRPRVSAPTALAPHGFPIATLLWLTVSCVPGPAWKGMEQLGVETTSLGYGVTSFPTAQDSRPSLPSVLAAPFAAVHPSLQNVACCFVFPPLSLWMCSLQCSGFCQLQLPQQLASSN